MDLPVNRFKQALAQQRVQIGMWSSIPSSFTVEILAGAGFDWILIDTEHAPNDLESVLTQLQAASAYPTTAIVRVPWNDPVVVKRYLDAGAQSLLIPFVSSEQEARAAVASTRYPPDGIRGLAGATRATRFGRIANYARHAAREICVLVQVETRQGLDELEAICAVDGVDGVFIGPADLHASLGHTGETANPAVKPLIDDALRRIRAAGKAPGILTSVESDARRWLDVGALFVAVGIDVSLLARGAEALARRFVEP